MNSQRTMLVVDDVPINRALFYELFNSEFNILQAANGRDAIDMLHRFKNSISVVLLDIVMPIIDGFGVLEHMKNDEYLSLIPVIVITSMGEAQAEIRALELGAADLIHIPFETLIVKKRVQNIVDRRQMAVITEQNIQLEENRRQNERYRLMRKIMGTVLCESDVANNGTRYYSDNISEIFPGTYDPEHSLLGIWSKNGVFHLQDADLINDFFTNAASSKKAVESLVIQLLTRDKGWQWYRLEVTSVRNLNGSIDRQLLMLNNVNDSVLHDQERNDQAEVIRMMADTMNAGLVVSECDSDRTIKYVHSNLCKLLGYTREEFLDYCSDCMMGAIYPPDKERATRDYRDCLNAGSTYRCEYRIRKKDGELLWVQDTGKKFVDSDGITRINTIITDITPLKNAINTLRYKAEYDELTGIWNKTAFYKRTRNLLNEHPSERFAVVRWDIDRFKVVNDLFGMNTGDELLRYIGSRLKERFVGKVTYGRLESDNFALCLPLEALDIDQLVAQITDDLSKFPIEFEIVPCFGIYMVDNANISVGLMCDRANLALRTVKGNYLVRYAIYGENMRSLLLQEQSIVNDMGLALTEKQFEVYYQPQYDHRRKTMIGAEALVRWLHPTKGLLPTAMFIEIFEQNGFITKLDEYVWESVCAMLRSHLNQGIPVVPVSVNVSRMDIYNPALCSTLVGLMNKYELDYSMIKLEITESAYVENPKQLIDTVKRLQQSGFKVLMDDFGSGYSSLNTLKDVPVDMLKLDLKFLAGDNEDGRGGNILKSIIHMARWLDLPVIAEGVETREQADFLSSLGCGFVQGYFYSRPLPQEKYEQLLKNTETSRELNDGEENLRAFSENNEFWDPYSQSTLIFNSFVGAAAIVSCSGESFTLQRVNEKFCNIVGETDESFLKFGKKLLPELSREDQDNFREFVRVSMESGEEMHMECRLNIDPPVWLRLRIQLIAKKETIGGVFFLSLDDITKYKQMELRAVALEQRLKELEAAR